LSYGAELADSGTRLRVKTDSVAPKLESSSWPPRDNFFKAKEDPLPAAALPLTGLVLNDARFTFNDMVVDVGAGACCYVL